MMELPETIAGAVYRPIYSPLFVEKFEKQRKDHILQRRIVTHIGRVCSNPLHKTYPMQNKNGVDLRGKRGHHAEGNCVIAFAMCEECRSLGYHEQKFNDCCEAPDEVSNDVIQFLSFGTHKELFGKEIN